MLHATEITGFWYGHLHAGGSLNIIQGIHAASGAVFPVRIRSDSPLARVTSLTLFVSTARRVKVEVSLDLGELKSADPVAALMIFSAPLTDALTLSPLTPRFFDEWWALDGGKIHHLQTEAPFSASYWVQPVEIELDLRITGNAL